MPVNFNLLRQAGPADFTEGLMQGQEQQNALLQQQQQRQLGEIQLRNALRGEQEAMAESEAVKGSASLEDLAGRYRKAGLGKQALATEAALAKQRTDKLTTAKTQMELMKTSATRIMANPNAAIQELQRYQQLTGVDMSDDIAQVQQMAPDQVKAWASGHALEADKLLPKFQSMSVPGVGVQTGTTDYTGQFTPGQLYKEQMSEYQQQQNRIAQGQLGLAQTKFAWEKANPGFELKEAEDGSMVGVNKRTLQAFPITIGGAAPAAAPTMPGAGMPGPRVPAPATAPTQVIPGMTSVLDQRAPAAAAPNMAPAAGTQLRGKGNLPAKFADTDMQLSGLAGSLKEFKDEVGKKLATGAKFLPAGADTARMQAKYTSLLMGVKDLYTLGALAGPDMSIIESQLTNPASWSGKMTSQKGFEEQIKVIEDMLKRTAVNLENTYGRQPRATKQSLESLGTGLPGASANNPLGLPGL